MLESDKPKFVEVMNALACSCRHTLTDMQVELYWLGSSDITMADFKTAASRLIGGRWFPSLEELRAAMPGSLTFEERSHLAWSQVLSTIQAHGYTASIDFEDKAINAAIASMGGWVQLCQSDSEWIQRFAPSQFKKLYVVFLSGGVPGDLGKPLSGHRFDVMPPAKIIPAIGSTKVKAISAPKAKGHAEVLEELAGRVDDRTAEFLHGRDSNGR